MTRNRRGGFTMIEVLLYASLLCTVMVLAMQLFRTAASIIGGGSSGAAARSERDETVRRMRADIWDAYEIDVGDAATVVIHSGDERSIVWRVDAKADAVSRTELKDVKAVGEQRWALRGAKMRIAADGARGDAVMVEWSAGAMGGAERVRLQLWWLGAGAHRRGSRDAARSK